MIYLTVQDVVAETQLSERSIYRAIKSGSLPAYKPCGTWRVHKDDLEFWMEGARNRVPIKPLPPTKLDKYRDVIPIR